MAWTAPRTWTAGEVVTAALLNVHLRDNLLAIGAGAASAWTAYSPTLRANSAVTGSTDCAYAKFGKIVHARGRLIVSSTSTSGQLALTLPPVTPLEHDTDALCIIGQGYYWDTAPGNYPVLVAAYSATEVTFRRTDNGNDLTNDLAAGDILTWTMTYEAA